MSWKRLGAIFWLTAAVAVLSPSAALAGGTNVTVTITGAGNVKETTPAAKLDCSSTGGTVDCGEIYWESNWFVKFVATPADAHWEFAGWDEGGSGELDCAVLDDTCSWTSGVCFFCAFHVKLGAKFARVDYDQDGYYQPADCNDDVNSIHPNALDVVGDGIDQDCLNGDAQDPDEDNDGFNKDGYGGPVDCSDTDPNVHPGAIEVPENGKDDDCTGGDAIDPDRDGDGFVRAEFGSPADCDDTDADVHPGATDVPENGVDEDCKGGDAIDPDHDDDGFNRPGLGGPPDCDDDNRAIHPGALDVADNAVDEDCDGADAHDTDRDRDGFHTPYDCDDGDPAIHPTASERRGNAIDENCDGRAEPWPQIVSTLLHAERVGGGRTRFTLLAVKAVPAGAKVTITCKKKGCPWTRRSRGAPSGAAEMKLTRLFRGSRLKPGATVKVTISHPEMSAKIIRLTIRRKRLPLVTTSCRAPGATATACQPV
jgi:hypothetical protein